MKPDVWLLYRQMLRSRKFEEAVSVLWQQGKISGEMHLGVGEEGIIAGVVAQLQDGDALTLDHRGTSALVVRGVDLLLLLRELLGCSDGLCGGMGGHMHLFSREHLAASSGIVGASGPAAAGFALAGQQLRPGSVAVAFFGDGAINQGMLMEAFNLAVVWELPVIFVCKNNEWAITTRSDAVTGGTVSQRAASFGLPVADVNGVDVESVWEVAAQAFARARNGDGPTFIHAACARMEGHFLGDPTVKTARNLVAGLKPYAGPLARAATASGGASLAERVAGLKSISTMIRRTMADQHWRRRDPLQALRRKLYVDKARLDQIEQEVIQEIRDVVESALAA